MTERVRSEEVLFVGEVLKMVISISFTLNSQEKSDAPGVGINKLYWYFSYLIQITIIVTIQAHCALEQDVHPCSYLCCYEYPILRCLAIHRRWGIYYLCSIENTDGN